jgi:hypothetical protein
VKRYARDPKLREFQAGIRAEVDRVAALAPKDGYVIYAIRDPSLTDVIRGHPDGPPVYVGQTRELRTRADNHMRDGGGGSTDTGCKTGRLKQIIDQWRVPKFEIPRHSADASDVADRRNRLGTALRLAWL